MTEDQTTTISSLGRGFLECFERLIVKQGLMVYECNGERSRIHSEKLGDNSNRSYWLSFETIQQVHVCLRVLCLL